MDSFSIEELQLIYQLYDSLRLRTRQKLGIDRDVFVKFCPLPGLWGHRLYKFMKNLNNSQSDCITFKNFVESLRLLCRSNCLDESLFTMFDISERNLLDTNELKMMLINLPDLGFTML